MCVNVVNNCKRNDVIKNTMKEKLKIHTIEIVYIFEICDMHISMGLKCGRILVEHLFKFDKKTLLLKTPIKYCAYIWFRM